MSDNVPITPGTGANVATDQLPSGEHVQFFKLMDGKLDSTVKAEVLTGAPVGTEGGLVVRPIPAGTQPISAASLPLPAGAASETTLAAINAKLAAALAVAGDVAAGAADSGNPVKVAGKFNTTPPTLTDGQRGDVQLSSEGSIRMVLRRNSLEANISSPSDAIGDSNGLVTVGQMEVWDPGLAKWQKARGDATNGLDVDVTRVSGTVAISAASLPLPASAAQEHTGAASPHSVRISTGAAFVDPRDRNWTITETVPVSGTFFQTTQPISAASLPLPSGAAQEHTSAAAPHSTRLTDGASFYDAAKTGQLPSALVSGRLDINIGGVGVSPISIANVETIADNAGFTDGTSKVFPQGYIFDEVAGTALTENDIAAARVDSKRAVVNVLEDATTRGQRMGILVSGAAKSDVTSIGGIAVAALAVPSGGFGVAAMPVDISARRKATYFVAARNIASGALVANTAKPIFSLEHALSSTKTVRLTKITVSGIASAAGAAAITANEIQITKGTAASSAGTAVTPSKANEAQAAAELTCKTLPTIVAGGAGPNWAVLISPAAGTTAGTLIPRTVVYDFYLQAADEEPLTLRAGVLESIVINIISTSTPNFTLWIEVELTEE